MKSTITTISLAELVLDGDLYPRRKTSRGHISRLRSALRANEVLPPIVADERTKIVVDGWHRHAAYTTEWGLDAEVAVDLRNYPHQKAMIEDMCAMNSSHGLPFDSSDLAWAMILCKRYGISQEKLSSLIGRELDDLQSIRKRKIAKSKNGDEIALKRTFRHKAGKVLTEKQEIVNDKAMGVPISFLSWQLIGAIEADLVDLENVRDVEALDKLYGVLGDWIES